MSDPVDVTHAFAKVSLGGGPTGASGPFLRPEDRFACSLSTVGVLYCWGGSTWHAMGVDEIDVVATFSSPQLVVTDQLFKDVSAGVRHSCGVTTAGVAWCWGDNSMRQLGNGDATRETKRFPDAVAGGLQFVSISAGNAHTCGVVASGPDALSGPVYCWGDNSWGQLGDGTVEPRATPTPISGALAFIAVSASPTYHTCGITTDFVTYCCGLNDNGQLGDGSTARRLVPTAVRNGATRLFRSISTGELHTCATNADNATYCWGANTNQQLGDGNTATDNRTTPSQVTDTFGSVSAGWFHTCGIGGGTAKCWGANNDGQLGDGGITERNAPPPSQAP